MHFLHEKRRIWEPFWRSETSLDLLGASLGPTGAPMRKSDSLPGFVGPAKVVRRASQSHQMRCLSAKIEVAKKVVTIKKKE